MGGGDDVRHLRPPFGERARFIQHHRIHLGQLLYGFCRFDEDAPAGARARRSHDGHRRGQPQRAGAGNHQHGDGAVKGKFKAAARDQPGSQRHRRNAHHHRHEDAGNAVGQFGNGRLGGGCLLHQGDDARNGGIAAHLFGAHLEIAAAADTGRGHAVPHRLFFGDGFPGQRRSVDGAVPLHDDAVCRDALPGAHHQNIAHGNLLGRDFHFLPVAQQRRRLGRQIHQLADGFGRLAAGTGFQIFAQGNERQDHARSLKIQIMHILLGQCRVAVPQPPGHAENGKYAISQCRAAAHGDERIHIGRAVQQFGKAARKILPVEQQNGQQQQKLGKGKNHAVFRAAKQMMQEGRRGQHMVHGDVHEHRQQNAGSDQALFCLLLRLFGQLSGALRSALLPRFPQGGAVARLAHGSRNLPGGEGRFVKLCFQRIGEQADRRLVHPRQFGGRLFHPRHTGCAGHAGNIKRLFDHFFPLFLWFYIFSRCGFFCRCRIFHD